MWILAQPFLLLAMFAKNYTGKNVTHLVNKDKPVAIAEEKKSCLLFFASICQHRNIRECFLPALSIQYYDAIVHIQKKMHRFGAAM